MSPREHEAELFFSACYIAWAVGMLDLEQTAELDAMSPKRWENWRQIVERKMGFNRNDLQALFHSRCQTMSDDEALDSMVQELLLEMPV